MPDKPEFSESGAPILRHTRETDFQPIGGPADSESIEAIEQHIVAHCGPYENVFHELVSDIVHVDVHIVPPRPERNYYTLVTTGMSDLPMTVPPGAEAFRFAEMVICLPPNWPMPGEMTVLGNGEADEAQYWPIRWLKQLARLPHEYQTWLGPDHTIPNGDPAMPFADNTRLCCALIRLPVLFGASFRRLAVRPDKMVNFFSLIPIYREEMNYKLKHGAEGLAQRLANSGVSELLDINRPNACRKRFGLF